MDRLHAIDCGWVARTSGLGRRHHAMKAWVVVTMLMLIATISCGEDRLRVDKFSVMAKLDGNTLSVWLDTDLPDDAIVRVEVHRTFDMLSWDVQGIDSYNDRTAGYHFDSATGQWTSTYGRVYPFASSTVAQWRKSLTGAFDENEWLVYLTGLTGLQIPAAPSSPNENEWLTYLKQNLKERADINKRILSISDKIRVIASYSHDFDLPAITGTACAPYACYGEVLLHKPTDLAVVTSLVTPNFGNGKHEIGRDITPGVYESRLNRRCYWERLRGFSGSFEDIITNGSGDGKLIVEIVSGDKAFVSQGCNPWVHAR